MSVRHQSEAPASRSLSQYLTKQVFLPLLLTGAAGLGLAGCGADSIAGVSQPAFAGEVSANLVGTLTDDDGLVGDDGLVDDGADAVTDNDGVIGGDGGLLEGSDHGDDDDTEFPLVESERHEKTDDEVEADEGFRTATETTFPVTEAMYNTCVNELVVLNGTQKERMVLESDGLTLKFKLRVFKDTRGVAATTDVWVDDDHNEFTPRVKKTVRYHNKNRYLDEFRAGPVDGLPFRSKQESVIWLQREGGWRHDGWDTNRRFGDDLFVFFSNEVKISQSGIVREETKFRTECK
jgi:hypothetical protein